MARKPKPTKQALAKATGPTDVVIAVNLRRLLMQRNKTREQLAAALGIGETTVDKYCNAKTRLSASRLWDVSLALNCEVADLFRPVPQ